ncbi:CorA-like Mg2+ transporter protein [Rhodanobacter glycinis]|uniref:CorA-like Mg2+ transporter protein n=1 Tax=Rhodanobacter glycinis TaxID=582702 RepID=A0A1I4BHS0_9GAMM|nr:CorA-like Mg2+ transporter protein [Rhodanobacter glycinis]
MAVGSRGQYPPTGADAGIKNTAATSRMVVNCVACRNDGTRIGDLSLDAISDVLKEPDTFVWVDLHESDESLLLKFQEEFDLHDLAIEDARGAHPRTKIESYGDSLFIVVQTAQLTGSNIAFGETHIFLGPRYLVTVRHGASLSYSPARRTSEHILEQRKPQSRDNQTHLAHSQCTSHPCQAREQSGILRHASTPSRITHARSQPY